MNLKQSIAISCSVVLIAALIITGITSSAGARQDSGGGAFIRNNTWAVSAPQSYDNASAGTSMSPDHWGAPAGSVPPNTGQQHYQSNPYASAQGGAAPAGGYESTAFSGGFNEALPVDQQPVTASDYAPQLTPWGQPEPSSQQVFSTAPGPAGTTINPGAINTIQTNDTGPSRPLNTAVNLPPSASGGSFQGSGSSSIVGDVPEIKIGNPAAPGTTLFQDPGSLQGTVVPDAPSIPDSGTAPGPISTDGPPLTAPMNPPLPPGAFPTGPATGDDIFLPPPPPASPFPIESAVAPTQSYAPHIDAHSSGMVPHNATPVELRNGGIAVPPIELAPGEILVGPAPGPSGVVYADDPSATYIDNMAPVAGGGFQSRLAQTMAGGTYDSYAAYPESEIIYPGDQPSGPSSCGLFCKGVGCQRCARRKLKSAGPAFSGSGGRDFNSGQDFIGGQSSNGGSISTSNQNFDPQNAGQQPGQSGRSYQRELPPGTQPAGPNGAPHPRGDLGFRSNSPTQRGGAPWDDGRKYDFEDKKKEFPPFNEIIKQSVYFGIFELFYVQPHFQGNTAFSTSSGITEAFDFDNDVGFRFRGGLESEFGPGIDLNYFQFDQNSANSSFTSDGLVTASTGAFMAGPRQLTLLTADDAGETLNAQHSFDLQTAGFAFFKELKFPISRLNGLFGIQYASIAQSLEANVVDAGGAVVDTLVSTSDFRAIGPRVGFEYFRPIGHTKLNLISHFGGALMFGNRDQFVQNSSTGDFSRVGADEFVSMFDFGLSVQYRFFTGEKRFISAKLGFNTQTWIGGGTAVVPQDDFGLRGWAFGIGFNR